MTNLDDKNNNSNVNKHSTQMLNHRTVVGGDEKNGQLQHKLTTQHSTDSIHDPVDQNFQPQLRWPDLCAQLFLHSGAIYGLVFQFYTIKFYTLIWCKYILVCHHVASTKHFRNFNICLCVSVLYCLQSVHLL